jgi:type II secretion system protein L
VTIAGDGGMALVLFGGDDPGEPMAWAQVSPNSGEVKAHGMAQTGASAPAAAPSRTVLVLSGAEAQLKRIALPARTEAQARAGVGYLFEGALAGVDDVHFAVGAAQDSDGHRLAAAFSKNRLAQWLEACRKHGANPRAIYLDCTLWPAAPGNVEIVAAGARAIVAGGRYGGYSIEAGLAGALLARWATQNGAPVERIGLSSSLAQSWTPPVLPGAPQTVTRDHSDPGVTLAAAAIDPPDYAPNLRQGELASTGPKATSWQIWRLAAVLAVIAALVQSGVQGLDASRDFQAAKSIAATAERDFRAARPDVKRISNLRAQVRAMANANTQAESHPVLNATDPVIRAQQAQPLVRLDSMRHAAPGRTVSLRFSAQSAESLEALAAWMRAQGLSLEVRETKPEDGRYTVEIALESPP